MLVSLLVILVFFVSVCVCVCVCVFFLAFIYCVLFCFSCVLFSQPKKQQTKFAEHHMHFICRFLLFRSPVVKRLTTHEPTFCAKKKKLTPPNVIPTSLFFSYNNIFLAVICEIHGNSMSVCRKYGCFRLQLFVCIIVCLCLKLFFGHLLTACLVR